MVCRSVLLFALAFFAYSTAVKAGESGLNTAVIVNQNSSNSVQLANDYCELRGVPPQNVLRLSYTWSGGAVSCSLGEFETNLVLPLQAMLQDRNLTGQIHVVVLSMDIPYQVFDTTGVNSATSILFYGFKPDDPAPAPDYPASCSMPLAASNNYCFRELPFAKVALSNSFMAVMLTDTNLAAAESILHRAVASDSTFPLQPVYLDKTSDQSRDVRYTEFNNAIFDSRIRAAFPMDGITTDSTAFTNVFGLETGLTAFSLPANAFIPGTIADNLTSYGGELFTYTGQTPALAFLEAGASATYGTVVEPCNYVEKFPNPLDYFYQSRGFSLAEAYYQSVEFPYQGIMLGEPLAAPYAIRGTGAWNSFSPSVPVLSGQTNLQVNFSAAMRSLPLNQVDLFIDGTWMRTLTNIAPGAGDHLTVTINNVTNGYTVPTNATLDSVAAGVAAILNAASASTFVTATAFGDRIELYSDLLIVSGSNITLNASSSNSMATVVTPSQPVFVDSTAAGFQNIAMANQPEVGDWVQLVATKTNGDNVTVVVTNIAINGTLGQLAQELVSEVNNNASLQSDDGILIDDLAATASTAEFNIYARTAGAAASDIETAVTASSNLMVSPSANGFLQGNMSDLEARNHLYISAGLSLPTRFTLDTTQLSDGYHDLTAVAYEGTSVRTQTRAVQTVLIQNTSLTATLSTFFGGSNTDVNTTLQFGVTASTTNLSSIQLYGTGGLIKSVTNQSFAIFSVPGASLGVGLHPFYAIVTDSAGHQYRTTTTQIRLIGPEPPIAISVTQAPLTLHWTATVGRTYDVLKSTNVLGPFQIAATVTPSTSDASWTEPNASISEEYYLIETSY